MTKLLPLLAGLLAAAALPIVSQGLSSFTEPTSGVTYSLTVQDTPAPPFALLLAITAPRNITWAGFATGGCMLRSPLLVAWPNGTDGVVVTTRWATGYHPPAPYPSPEIAVFRSSGVNASHWTADFVCFSACSEWVGGSIDTTGGNATFGYAVSSQPVAAPGSANSSIKFHNIGMGHFEVSLGSARMQGDVFNKVVGKKGPAGIGA